MYEVKSLKCEEKDNKVEVTQFQKAWNQNQQNFFN